MFESHATMPTVTLQLADALPTLILPVACLLMGGALGVGVYALSGLARAGSAATLTAELTGEARALSARPRAEKYDGLLGVAMGLMPVFLPVAKRLPLGSFQRDLAQQYARAGWPGALRDEELMGIALQLSLVLAVVLGLLGLVIAPAAGIVGALLGLVMGPMLVSSSLSSRVRERDRAITRTIPFVLDLLVLTMRAGASLQIAMRQVCDDYRQHPIGVEFANILADIEMGSTSRQSFVNFARRTPVPIVKYLVDEIVQSDELGRPIAQTLDRLAEQTRVRRVQDATSTAGTAKVAVLAPGVLILFAGLIILLAPFGLKILYANSSPNL